MIYEENLIELEKIIEKLNNPKTSMKEALSSFETGVEKVKECQKELTTIKGKVTILKEELGKFIEEEE